MTKETDHILAYIWLDRFPGGSDPIITILLDIISRALLQPSVKVLYLWLDNCWRENKNRYMIAICAWLVDRRVFLKVYLLFLPKGHTHVVHTDGVFSHYARKLQHADVYTVDDLLAACRDCYTPKPEFIILRTVGSFSTALSAFIQIRVEGTHTKSINLQHQPRHETGHSKPRAFRFKMGENGRVLHHYRLQCQPKDDHAWMPHNAGGYCIFTGRVPDLQDVPCVPYIPVCDDLAATVCAYKDFMNDKQKTWWEDNMSRMKQEDAQQCSQCTAYRTTMIVNARCKKDEVSLATQKASAWQTAYKSMQKHLEEPSSSHPVFTPAITFPVGRLQRQEPDRALSSEMKDMSTLPVVQKIAQQQVEGIECHFVGPRTAVNQRSHHTSEMDIEVGQVCVVRGEDDEDDEEAPLSRAREVPVPWWVGIITSIKFAENSLTVEKVTVHECSNAAHVVSTRDAKHLRWFKNKQTKQEQFLAHDRKQPEKGFDPVVTEIYAEALVRWGSKDKILTQDHRVKHNVLLALSNNNRVKWQM